MRYGKLLIPLLFLATLAFMVSSVYADDPVDGPADDHTMTVALVVKDKDSLSELHERRIDWVLRDMDFDVTLVDKNVATDYQDFDLIIVAGRPTGDQLDSFAASIPVNEMPTIAMGNNYLTDWGWADSPGISSWTSSKRQSIYITEEHALTWRYFLDEKFYVHTVQGYNMIDLVDGYTNLQSVVSASTKAKYGVIRYGLPGALLYDGKEISDDSAVVFFGITYPNYWTEDAEQLFKNAVVWLTEDTDGDGLKDYMDNCIYTSNPGQADIDADGTGDACDTEDNRPDLTVRSIELPAERIQCEDLGISVSVENVGNGDAASYDVELKVDDIVYNVVGDELPMDESDSVEFTVAGGDLCGSSKITLTASVKDSQPSELDGTNNQLTTKLIFTTVKTDVDGDSELEEASDKNDDITDGYEAYADGNSNTDATSFDGDPDGMTDYLIDIEKNGSFEKYWDPDDAELTDVVYQTDNETGNGTGEPTDVIEIDFDGNGDVDATYNTTSGEVTYMDETPPVVGTITVDPTFDGSIWYIFDVSADVSDDETGIDEDSCEYTTDDSVWFTADYYDGECRKSSITADIGEDLTLNIRVKDRVGNPAAGSAVVRAVALRPLSVVIETDKSSYARNESAAVSGYVSYADSGERIEGATIAYSFDSGSVTGGQATDENGYYEFDLTTPNSYGKYPLTVDASHTFSEGSGSLDLSVPAPVTAAQSSQSSSSSSSSGIGMPSAAMIVYAPKNISAYTGTDEQFVVTINNIGAAMLHAVKVNVDVDAGITADVRPSMIDLNTGQSQDFTVTLHIPAGATGEHSITIYALSYETDAIRKIGLTVTENPTAPEVEVTGVDVPELFVDEAAEVSITLRNVGDGEGLVTESLAPPVGWDFEINSFTVRIAPSSEKTVTFLITPKSVAEKIEFVTSYKSKGQDVVFVKSVDVSVMPGELLQEEEEGKSQSLLTSMLVLVSNPAFYITALSGSVLIALFTGYHKGLFGYGKVFGTMLPHRAAKRSKPSFSYENGAEAETKSSSAYDKWERRYKRTRSK